MKRILTLLIGITVFTLILAGCGKKEPEVSAPAADSSQSQVQEKTEEQSQVPAKTQEQTMSPEGSDEKEQSKEDEEKQEQPKAQEIAQPQEEPKKQENENKQEQAENTTTPEPQEKSLTAVELIPEVPSSVYVYSDGLGMFNYNSKKGFLDSNGKVFIEPKYSIMGNGFSEGLAILEDKNGKIVIVDTKGKEVFADGQYNITASYATIFNRYCFHDGRAILDDSKRGYRIIDTAGKEIYSVNTTTEPEDKFYGFAPHMYYSSGRMIWRHISNGDIKITDTEGNVILDNFPTAYKPEGQGKAQIIYSDNLLSLPDKNNLWGVIDTSGKTSISFTYEELGYAGEGLIPFMKYQKWGYIDYKGKVVIEPQYEKAYVFSNGLAAVKVGGKLGFINTKNEMIIEPQFLAADFPNENRFNDMGLAVVKSRIIDRKGNTIVEGNIIYYNGGDIVNVGIQNPKVYRIK
jgi:predicted small lipoprotein YifL